MDTIKSFKGYGKVDELEEQSFRRKTRKRLIVISVSAIVLLALVIGAVVGTLIHKNNNNNNTESTDTPSSPTTPAESIKAVCSVTQYPDSCFSSISSLQSSNKADPEELFKLSLQVAVNELSKLSSLPEKLIGKANDARVEGALRDCQGLFEDAIDQLNTSISSMQVRDGGEKLLSASKINDIKTWLSTTITDQETCLDGLEEVNSTLLVEVKTAMKNSTEFSSNSLAIVAKILTILEKLDIPIHRKLLGLGNDFPEWIQQGDRRLLQEANPKPDLTVAKDGSGDYKTIKEALDSVPKKNASRFVIYVKEGVYSSEKVIVDKAHWNVMMYGDGKTKTIISGNLNFVDGTPTFSTATFAAVGRGFIARDMGFKNTAGPEKHQAVAFRSGSDRSVFYRCSFDAFQDTLYAHSNRQFYRDCDITGTIDFIFGNAAVVLQNCNIQPRQPMSNQFNTITAQGKKDPNQNTGISIQSSQITPFDKLTASTYLGRPWKDYSTTVIMQTNIGGFVDPTGWKEWVSNVDPPSTIFYAEYQNMGNGSSVDKRVKWGGYKPTITDEQAGKFTVDSFIQGSEWLPQSSVTYDGSL
ncbi:hypothetical protein HHK36_021947 [Tetracentron sinense]|uniref:Pectinesterase n=1 Tax=Tetracentron sinense TaxID=13715 RepID=A0A834YU12_TETSI|nr:hypothetical protein HHK36_021947 [Tetracentron sinense]